ncbi:MAG TPA: DUF3631 domain-containing protein [Candidatus Acidoferrum sp.]|nr:DUF3631 domain-containing protein [Candidatus Acidoferrum sp.]
MNSQEPYDPYKEIEDRRANRWKQYFIENPDELAYFEHELGLAPTECPESSTESGCHSERSPDAVDRDAVKNPEAPPKTIPMATFCMSPDDPSLRADKNHRLSSQDDKMFSGPRDGDCFVRTGNRTVAAAPGDAPRAVAVAAGSELLRDIEAFLLRFVILPPHTALPLALWSLLTHAFDSFDACPYLAITSPAPRCGKTRLLECLDLLVSSPRRASNISEAALFRTIEKFQPTLMLDEAETLSGKSERAEYLRQILNAGNRRGAVVTRCIGQGANLDAMDFSVFCPKVLAGIGTFPQTIADRAIVIAMQRRKNSERVDRFLHRMAKPEGEALRKRAENFMDARREEISAAYLITNLEFISDRDAEAWAPLFAILSVADAARAAELQSCAEILTHTKAANAEDDSLSLRLLADVRNAWPPHEPKIFTADLVQRLKAIEDGPWASDERFDGRRLSRLLKPFGVIPTNVQINAANRKGYYRQDAEAAFGRYLGPQQVQP